MITVLWCVKYARKYILDGFPCEMDFSPLVSESQPRRKRQSRWDSDTRGEKNPSHKENHTKWISSPQLTGCKSHTESSWTPGNRHRLYSWYIHWQMRSDMMYSWNNWSWVISCLASMWIWHHLTSLTFFIPTSQPGIYTDIILHKPFHTDKHYLIWLHVWRSPGTLVPQGHSVYYSPIVYGPP